MSTLSYPHSYQTPSVGHKVSSWFGAALGQFTAPEIRPFETPAAKIASAEELKQLLEQLSTGLTYRIVPDSENPLDTLFEDREDPWALFWQPGLGKQFHQGTFYWLKLMAESNNKAYRCLLTVSAVASPDQTAQPETVSFSVKATPTFMRQCHGLLFGTDASVRTIGQLLEEVSLEDLGKLQGLLMAEPAILQRYAESLFNFIELFPLHSPCQSIFTVLTPDILIYLEQQCSLLSILYEMPATQVQKQRLKRLHQGLVHRIEGYLALPVSRYFPRLNTLLETVQAI